MRPSSKLSAWMTPVLVSMLTCCRDSQPQNAGESPPTTTRSTAAEPFPAPEDILAQASEGIWVNIDFVAHGHPQEEARRCVQSRDGAVACFAFPSHADYEASQPEAAGNFKGELCWSARWQRNGNRQESGQDRPVGGDCPTPSRRAAPEPPPPVSSSGDPIRVRLDFDIERDDAGRARITGTTNLPNGTVLSYSIGDVALTYLGQDKGTVQVGRFESTWFSFRGGPYPAEQYKVGVTVPFRNAQPVEVKAVLGENLERMEGPLVRWMSIRELGKVASRERIVRL